MTPRYVLFIIILSAGYLLLQYPGIRGRRKWRPKEEMGGNGRAREGEREKFLNVLPLFAK